MFLKVTVVASHGNRMLSIVIYFINWIYSCRKFHLDRDCKIGLWKCQYKIDTLGIEIVDFSTTNSNRKLAQVTTRAEVSQ